MTRLLDHYTQIIILAVFLLLGAIRQVGAVTMPINNITVSAVKTDSVSISWDSTEAGTSIIEYGLTASYGFQTQEDSLSYFHTQIVTGLTEGTLYHCRIHSKDYNGAETLSGDYAFTTRTQSELEAVIRSVRADGGLPKTYYVKPASGGGDNNNEGTSIDTAWATPSYAVSKADVGDTIYLMDGTWTDVRIDFNGHSGISTHNLTITNYNGSNPIFHDNGTSGNIFNLYPSYGTMSYIVISNITFEKSGPTAINIRGPGTHHIYVDNVKVVSPGSGNNINVINAHDIWITNSDLQGGFNTINVEASRDGIDAYNITIRGNHIHHNTLHGGINFANVGLTINSTNHDVLIENNRIDNISSDGIYTIVNNFPSAYNYMDRFIIRGNIFGGGGKNAMAGMDFLRNPEVYNNTFSGPYISYNFETQGNSDWGVYFHDNFCGVASTHLNLHYGSATGSTISNNTNCSVIRSYESPLFISDNKVSSFTITLFTGATAVVSYTDGTVFSENGLNTVNYYSNRSEYMTDVNEQVSITTYPMTARPSSDSATITVHKFDTSLSKGNVLVDFSADTTDGNNVDFIIGELKADTNYQITRAGLNYHVIKSNANKCIAFFNSEWSAKTFTVTETDASADIITPAYVELGSRINHIDLDGNGVINILDIVLVAQHFGESTTSPYPAYDINSDGSVDILDIRLVAEGM